MKDPPYQARKLSYLEDVSVGWSTLIRQLLVQEGGQPYTRPISSPYRWRRWPNGHDNGKGDN